MREQGLRAAEKDYEGKDYVTKVKITRWVQSDRMNFWPARQKKKC